MYNKLYNKQHELLFLVWSYFHKGQGVLKDIQMI